MTITNTILARRSIKRASNKPIERVKIDKLLEDAAYAPFHSKTEPWHTYVIGSDAGKTKLLEAIKVSLEAIEGSPVSEEKLEKTKQKIATPPYLLLITAEQIGDEKKDFEAIGAVSAFIQNFQLLAWEAGIGMIWRTNNFIFNQAFNRALGIPVTDKVVGILYLSVIEDNIPKPKPRKPITEWVTDIE